MKNSFYLTQCLHPKQIGMCLLLSLILLFGFADITPAYESFTATISFYQGFTISDGMTTLDPTVITIIIGNASEISAISAPDLSPLFEFSPQVDLYFGLTTDPNYPIEVVAERIAGMAVLEDSAFEDVTDDLLATLDFTEQVVTIDSNDLVVLLLNEDQDEYAMLGDVTKYPDATVHFTYWKSEIPEASTLVLLGVGIVGLIGIMKRKQQNRSRKGGRGMKHIKTLLFSLVLLPLLVGTASAKEVELRVIRIGSGDGFVMGEDIWCGDECKWNYEEGTVVQLKAEPDPDSRFVGWLINDQPHEDVVTIDQDTIVKAIFELKVGRDLDIYWYNGDTKRRATMVLDEVAVFIEPWEKWGVSTQAEAIAAAQEIAQQFHPQAVVSEQYEDYLLLVKSPEPVEKGQLPDILFSLKELKYVRQASPVFYINPAYPSSQLILTDEIYVRFPDKYTKDQIAAIEAEYSLILVEAIPYVPNGFRYRVSDPLEALDVANRLYESGLVEVSFPEMVEEYTLDSKPNDTYFGDQWHLENTGQYGGVAGEDVNILPAWNTAIWNPDILSGEYVRGSGVVIAIVDNGVEIDHEDLAPNVRHDLCYDFIDGDPDPSPAPTAFVVVPFDPSQVPLETLKAKHGTAVAGVAAASCFLLGNNKGVCGSAPDAEIAGYRAHIKGVSEKIVGNPNLKGKPGSNADALFQFHQDVHIYNNSWGSDFILLDPLKDYEEIALRVGVKNGRHGLGSIFVFSGGNMNRMFLGGQWKPDGSNSNYVGFKNSRYTIAVAASDNEGKQSLYSAPGANILVNAPSSDGWAGGARISTTDRSGLEGYNPYDDANGTDYPNFNYTNSFGGTSAAAPLLSGIIALMLQVNSTLSWRDVQHILIETAEKNDPTDDDWIDNAAGHHFNHKYGAGRVDAKAAVDAALTWKNVADEVETSPKGRSKDTIEITDNIQIEFVEVTLTTPYHFREDLTVVLFSPHGTHSVLGEPHPTLSSIEHYDNWQFGSVRHFGESSKGEWNLVLVDKKIGNPVTTRYFWKIKFYGTELPPYVKAVEARSGDELIYHAEWVNEEDGQLEWVESVEPHNPSNTTPLHLTIVTSEAMQWLSLNLFGKDFHSASTDPARKIQKADDSGMIWEVTIEPSDFPQDNAGELSDVYTLTITGQDSGDLYLLPFADRTPKTLPTHPADADWPAQPNAGDTVHQIGKILSEPFEWRITMPTPGDCDYDIDHGGIVCTFDEEKNRVTFSPKDIDVIKANVQYVIIGSVGQNSTTWEGTYQVPTEGSGDLTFGMEWEPQEAWFPFREPTPDQQELWCAENPPDYKPNEPKGPPASGTDTATLQWTISAQPNPDPATERCQIRVTWETEDGQAIEEAGELLLDVQPESLCEAFQDQSETLEATATYPWEVANRLQYFGCHIVDEQTELRENIGGYHTAKYWPIPLWENVLEPGQCRSWYTKEQMFQFFPEKWPSQPPQDIPRPTSPEEGSIAIHYDCEWREEEKTNPTILVYPTHHWTFTYRCPTVYVDGEGRQKQSVGGYFCDQTITHITWECGDKCTYQELPGEFVPPVPGLERELTLRP